jgi:hypothetical protein
VKKSAAGGGTHALYWLSQMSVRDNCISAKFRRD